MYVGRKYTVTRSALLVLPFKCRRCGFGATMRVLGIGQGAGNSAYFLDDEGAQRRATDSAVDSAKDDAHDTVKMAPCPQCGHRDSGYLQTAAAISVVILVLFVVLGLFMDGMSHDSSMGMFIFVPLGLLSAGFYYWTKNAKWSSAPMRVEVVGDEPKP